MTTLQLALGINACATSPVARTLFRERLKYESSLSQERYLPFLFLSSSSHRPDFLQDIDRAYLLFVYHNERVSRIRADLVYSLDTWNRSRCSAPQDEMISQTNQRTSSSFIYSLSVRPFAGRFPLPLTILSVNFYDDVIPWLSSYYTVGRAIQSAGRMRFALLMRGSSTVAPSRLGCDQLAVVALSRVVPSSFIYRPSAPLHPTAATSSVFFSPNGHHRADARAVCSSGCCCCRGGGGVGDDSGSGAIDA